MSTARPLWLRLLPKTFIICSSTYGAGDIPDNDQAFYAELREQRPDLSHIRYEVACV